MLVSYSSGNRRYEVIGTCRSRCYIMLVRQNLSHAPIIDLMVLEQQLLAFNDTFRRKNCEPKFSISKSDCRKQLTKI